MCQLLGLTAPLIRILVFTFAIKMLALDINSASSRLMLGEDFSIFTNEYELYSKCINKKFIVVLVYDIKNNFEFTISDSTLVGEFKLENRNIIADLEP